MKNRLFWALLLIALALGMLITWVDSRPTWDDTGISAGVILLVTGTLGLVMPERAWLWALAVGAWIPLMGILVTHNYGSILALVIAFIGAYLGVLAQKSSMQLFAQDKAANPDQHPDLRARLADTRGSIPGC